MGTSEPGMNIPLFAGLESMTKDGGIPARAFGTARPRRPWPRRPRWPSPRPSPSSSEPRLQVVACPLQTFWKTLPATAQGEPSPSTPHPDLEVEAQGPDTGLQRWSVDLIRSSLRARPRDAVSRSGSSCSAHKICPKMHGAQQSNPKLGSPRKWARCRRRREYRAESPKKIRRRLRRARRRDGRLTRRNSSCTSSAVTYRRKKLTPWSSRRPSGSYDVPHIQVLGPWTCRKECEGSRLSRIQLREQRRPIIRNARPINLPSAPKAR